VPDAKKKRKPIPLAAWISSANNRQSHSHPGRAADCDDPDRLFSEQPSKWDAKPATPQLPMKF